MKKLNFRLTDKQIRFAVIAGIVFLILLFVDQITKAAAEAIDVKQNEYFLGIIRLWATVNEGMAFSFFSQNYTAMVIITILTVFMIIGIAVLFFTIFKKNPPAQVCLAIIEAGAIGNLIDRLYFGHVRDFLDVSPLHFGICNPADFYITFGAIALVFIILFIGPSSMFPLKKSWREEAKRLEAEKEEKKKNRHD
ncbi:MAG: signal peptidase II [Clostridia bacterium]|nr:signal peptidase II [Clostridia bacterium]